MLGSPIGFWGKLELRDEVVVAWHPLEDHCADVAACAEALLQRTLLCRRLARLGGLDDLDAVTVARLCALAALHDLGKFNQHFQNKGRPGALPREGHVRELMILFGRTATSQAARAIREALPLASLRHWGGGDDRAMRLLFASIGHHGRPVPFAGDGVSNDPARWAVAHGLDPFAGMRALVDATRRWFPDAWATDAAPLPSSRAFAHAFAGLVMLADWMGSDRALFPFSDVAADRIAFARAAAARALKEMHLDAAVDRAAMLPAALDFTTVTGRQKPHDAQAKTLALPIPAAETLTLLESETGSGKTEAALMRFLQLFKAGAVDGMYFALPTRTAATQLHARLTRQIARAFPDAQTRAPVVLAVPGYLAFDDQRGQRLPGFKVLWKDDSNATRDGQSQRHRGWAAEHPKRFLAAPIAVGTIDQVLLSTLTVEHAHLRATSLLRQFLVIDEVHASDAYMTELLRSVLRFHLAAGGHALLMSATLGSALREPLFEAKIPSLAEAERVHYPLVTHREGTSRDALKVAAPGNAKSVAFVLRAIIDDPAAVAHEALLHAGKGARVLVLRNTVRDAVETQLALEALAFTGDRRALLFRCENVVTAHHARFAKSDREALDAAIERDYGGESPSVGRVVVATQTVQQSLDLDADILLTDLCPMDVLLQRVGRLHRHKRVDTQRRPEGYDDAVAVLLVPEDRDLTRLLKKTGEARGAHGHGTVYEDLRVLHATWCQIEAHPSVSIPAMNRLLVERTTHPEALDAVAPASDPRWASHAMWCMGLSLGKRRAAELCLLPRDERSKPFGECAFPDRDLGLRISTRLGEGDRRVVFEAPPVSPFGHPVRELTIPAWMVDGIAADAPVTLGEVARDRFAFTFGPRRFVYDRLGLRADDGAPAEELTEG